MSLLHTSFALRRLFLGPVPLHKPCAPDIKLVHGASHCHTRTTRPPWAHQIRFSSSGQDDDDPYKVLGLPSDVPQSKIKPVFYNLAKESHPDASNRANKRKFQRLLAAYERLETPESRRKTDAELRERERQKAPQRARDAAAAPRAARPKEPPNQSSKSPVGEARFVSRETLTWMKKFRKIKEEEDAQRQRDLAAKKQREAKAQKEQKQREPEATLRDMRKASAQTKASNDGAASHEKNEAKSDSKSESKVESKAGSKSEPRDEPRDESSPRDKTSGKTLDEGKRGQPPARQPTVNLEPESLKAAVLQLSPETTIPAVVEGLASCAVGSLADIQIKKSGATKLDFSTAGAARKLQDVIRREKFTVNGKKVKEMTLRVSVLPAPQDPQASRVLWLTNLLGEMDHLDSKYVKFILRQNGLSCPWVGINHAPRSTTEVHFSSLQEAEKARRILESLFPGIPINYGIDPAAGYKDAPKTFPYVGCFVLICCAWWVVAAL